MYIYNYVYMIVLENHSGEGDLEILRYILWLAVLFSCMYIYTLKVSKLSVNSPHSLVRWPSEFACPVTIENSSCPLPQFAPTWDVSHATNSRLCS